MTAKADRFNEGKPKLSFNLLSTEANAFKSYVWEYGDTKYGRGNWLKGCPWTEAADSLLRHVSAFLNGENNDPETGLPHVSHAQCSADILAHSFHTRKDLDDRNHAPAEVKRECNTCASYIEDTFSEPCTKCVGLEHKPNWVARP